MTKLIRITAVPGTLEVVTGGRCLVATPAGPDGPTFEVCLEEADADALMRDPGIAMHFRAEAIPQVPDVTHDAATKIQEEATAPAPKKRRPETE